MIPLYKFLLNNGSTQMATNPVWKDDLSLEYAYEQGQMFRRGQLSGNLIFVGSDYDFIMATPFDQAFALEIQVSYDNGVNWQVFFDGEFYMTDCTIKMDDRSVTVKPKVKDKYSKLLAGIDKEYDLIKLTPAIQPVTITRRPMIQVYVPGDTVVSCFLSDMQWEQDANETDDWYKLRNDYHFSNVGAYMEITLSIGGSFSGTYPNPYELSVWLLDDEGGSYIVKYYQEDGDPYHGGIRVYARTNPNTVLWEYDQEGTAQGLPESFTLASKRTGYSDITATCINTTIYARLCLATTMFNGHVTYEIPDDDIVPYNRNYRYCYPYGLENLVTMTNNSQVNPTEWGVRPDGSYFLKPAPSLNIINYFPIARSNWNYSSLWFNQTPVTEQLEPYGRKTSELKDAFTLEAVIKALLNVIDPTIHFEASQIYSRFLYGQNPLMQLGWGRLVMTPKSNILVAEYSQPARKAPVTLSQVLNMLRDVCGCYWYLNDSKQLIIEHISWFKNGGSYSGVPAIGIDITIAENTRNGKMLSFGTNEYSYDKLEMPERYQYSWMDDSTETFKGQAIDVLSGYVEQGKIEEVTVDGFNADLDYMMLNPSTVSEDGFALMCCAVNNGHYSTVIDNVRGVGSQTQNWQLAFATLQRAFLISDMPSWSIKVDGYTTQAKGIQRKKTQKVDIPVGYINPNMQTLVKTGIGTGEIKSMSIKLTSRMAKTTIIYDTTQQ